MLAEPDIAVVVFITHVYGYFRPMGVVESSISTSPEKIISDWLVTTADHKVVQCVTACCNLYEGVTNQCPWLVTNL